MRRDTLFQLTSASTIHEVPGHQHRLDGAARARRLAELFHDLPDLPGVLLTENGVVTSAISRRYYLEMVGSYCGKDLYLSRPIHLMMDPFEKLGGALRLPSNLPIHDAVERGLSRRRELVYEPLIVHPPERDESTTRLVDFEDLLLADSRLSSLRQRQMAQILGMVNEGLLLILPDHTLAAECSRSAELLLGGRHLAGLKLEQLLADRIEGTRCRLAAEYIEILFRADVIESLVRSLNPLAKVEIRNPGELQPRIITFSFVRQLENRRVTYLLAQLEDVTREEEQARQLEQQKQTTELRLTLAVALAEADPGQLLPFLTRLEALSRTIQSFAAGRAAPHQALARELHGLKGEAGLLGLDPLRAALHELESGLAGGELGAPLSRLITLLAEAQELIGRFRRFTHRAQAPPPPPSRLEELIELLHRHVERVASELGKLARFVPRVASGLIPESALPWLFEVLPQLANNALTHGIEAPSERLAAGKPAIGTLLLAARAQAGSGRLELIFQDDGAGLDLEQLRQRAVALGLPASSPEALARVVFHPGLSTADSVGDYAGRGAGLDVVRTRIEAQGGKVSVASERGRFCAFRLLLPLPVEVAA